jgi:predicted lipoprotein with Yx(FWY)xxD motif
MQKKLLWPLIVIVIVIIVIGIIVGTHKSTPKTPPASSSTKSTTSSTTAAVNNSVVTTKSGSVGQYLADPSGKTLYTYDADTATSSSCTGSCLDTWPAYIDSGATTGLPTNVSTIKRSDNGEMQYTYKGKPLYYFESDSSAGQVNGNGVGGFYVATP